MDYNSPIYNNISTELKRLVREHMPERGKVVYFESVRPKARGTTLSSIDRIFDPFTKEYVDIAYITGHKPAKGKDGKPSITFGRLQFTKADAGRMAIRGGDAADENKFMFLFLTNQLEQNRSAEWFVRNDGRQPLFRLLKPAASAREKLANERLVRQAGNAIDEMSNSELKKFAIGLEMKGITTNSDPDEIRVRLLEMAKKPAGAQRVLNLRNDVELRCNILIKDAERLGIITKDLPLNTWRWTDTGDPLCIVPPQEKWSSALVRMLLSPRGSQIMKTLENLVDAQEGERKAQKTHAETILAVADGEVLKPKKRAGRPPGSKNKSK